MARRNFITTGDLPAALGGMNGDQLSRLGYAIDRFAGTVGTPNTVTASASVPYLATMTNVRDVADFGTDFANAAWDNGTRTLTISGPNVVNPSADTVYYIVDATVRFNAAGSTITMGANTGNRVYFVNCYIEIENVVNLAVSWI